MHKPSKEELIAMLGEFVNIYSNISIYLHQIKLVWEALFKIMDRFVSSYEDIKSILTSENKITILNKLVKVSKTAKYIADEGTNIPEIE